MAEIIDDNGYTPIPKLEIKAVANNPDATQVIVRDQESGKIYYIDKSELGGNFVPLSGTEEGKPITGSLEYDGYNLWALKYIDPNGDLEDIGIYVDDGNFNFQAFDGTYTQQFGFGGSTTHFYIAGSNPLFKGLLGGSFFNKQNDPKSFAQLGDIATTNATATPLSLSDLNTAYPTQGTGFKVICPALNLTYIKSSLTTWDQFATTTVV